MSEATEVDGESGRWGRALLLTIIVHAGLLLAGLAMQGAVVKEAPEREEPELVFFSFPPPPAAASSATPSRAAVAERVQRQARTRLSRPATPLPMKAPVEPALEVPTEEPASPEAAHDEAAATDEAPVAEGGAAMGPAGVGGVVAGLVGGVLDGREGGMVGATGGSALELKQVARAPQVLKQVKPQYPRRAKADGVEGLVVVRVIIGTDGRIEPENTRVLRSVPGLDAAAISAVSQWRFSPALGHQGRAVRVIIEIPLQFSLK